MCTSIQVDSKLMGTCTHRVVAIDRYVVYQLAPVSLPEGHTKRISVHTVVECEMNLDQIG